MRRDYRLYLDDIVNAAAKVRRYIEGLDAASFSRDEKTVDAVVRNVGEAVKSGAACNDSW